MSTAVQTGTVRPFHVEISDSHCCGDGSARGGGVKLRSPARPWCFATLCVFIAALLLVPAATAQTAATFVSKRYGYSLVLPGSAGRWGAKLALVNLTGSTTRAAIDSIQSDVFTDSKTQRGYFLAARPNQRSLQEWAKFVLAIRDSRCGTPHQLSKPTLGGEPALTFVWSCTIGFRGYMVAALHAGRGYFMLVASPTALSRASDVLAFDAARHSFRFLRS